MLPKALPEIDRPAICVRGPLDQVSGADVLVREAEQSKSRS